MAFVEQTGPQRWRVRYWTDQGVHGTISGFDTKTDALAKAREIDADRRRGTFIDPAAGQLTLAEWTATWFESIDVSPATESQYRGLTRNHILTRWGTTAIAEISGIAVHTWAAKLRTRLAASTVATILKILSMMLADATEERLIPANPIRPQRRGQRRHTARREAQWATPEQALRIALQASALVDPWAGVLMVTAAWTGARWGELTGLQRHNLHLHTEPGQLVIEPRNGALHEVDGRLYLGPPKTAESARPITLPPFLVDLLRHHLGTHDHRHVFVTTKGELLRRSNFARRAMRPAADGTVHHARPKIGTQPVVHGLTFHGLRHSHKTWLIADGIPQVAQARRLGHVLPDKIEDIYSHVAPEIDTRLLAALQARWLAALSELGLDNRTVTTPSGACLPSLAVRMAVPT